MRLRTRLLVFSTGQLVALAILLGIVFAVFRATVLPMVEQLLASKADHVSRAVASDLDVGVGAADSHAITTVVDDLMSDPDIVYVDVRDGAQHSLLVRGTAVANAFVGLPYFVRETDGALVTWAPVTFEGIRLGSVAVATSTARLDALATWTRRVAAIALLLWLAAFVYSVRFARAFVVPIHAMTKFSHAVASGAFDQRLDVEATDELRELRDDLNEMTRDLAERRDTAARMQAELVSVSRMAGMAEVATGVLHNVGNVLNSLNVSVSLIDGQLQGSRVAGLVKSMALVDGHPGGFAAFLDTPKGRLLPEYIQTVTKQLAAENKQMREELGSVSRNVAHIKAIVSHQQAYARPSGLREQVDVKALLEEALQLAEGSLANRRVEVVRDFGEVPAIQLDRHKLLQILINLISNARHALVEVEHPRVLTAKIARDGNVIAITIADNGIGIAPENLPKIFQHGFTTKKNGHGFGLHASAIAARELDGKLVVASAGVGAGATFTVELPVQQRTGRITCPPIAIAS